MIIITRELNRVISNVPEFLAKKIILQAKFRTISKNYDNIKKEVHMSFKNFVDLATSRYSVRNFLNKKVPESEIQKILHVV